MRSLVILIALVAADQWLKNFVRADPLEWSGAFLFLKRGLFENDGLLFSIPAPLLFIILAQGIVLLAVAACFGAAWRRSDTSSIALALILAGGISNFLDRVRWEAVTDIFAFPGGLTWNVADVFVLLGLVAWGIETIWHTPSIPRQS